jgi:type II secretory pathway component PulF
MSGCVGSEDVSVVLARHACLMPAIRALAADPLASGQRAWRSIAAALESGNPDEARRSLARYTREWLPLLTLPADDPRCLERLLRIATEHSSEAENNWTALIYPLVVVGVVLAVLSGFAGSVLPIFEEMFRSFGLELPALSKIVLSTATLLAHGVWVVVFSCGVVGGITLAARASWHRPVTHIRFGRALVDCLSAGMPLDKAVPWAARAARLPVGKTCRRFASGLWPNGPAMAVALQSQAAAPILLTAVVENNADKVRAFRGTLQWLLGPVAVLLMGLAIGFTALVLFLPLVKLVGSLS